MVNERYSMAMAETLHYLKGISQNDVKKIPNKFMEFLKANASQNYECEFDYTKPLKDLELMNETRGLIAMICLNYWCETEEQKNNFIKHLSENEMRYQEELRKEYNVESIFKENKTIQNLESTSQEKDKLLILKKQDNIIKRLFNYIIKLLQKN